MGFGWQFPRHIETRLRIGVETEHMEGRLFYPDGFGSPPVVDVRFKAGRYFSEPASGDNAIGTMEKDLVNEAHELWRQLQDLNQDIYRFRSRHACEDKKEEVAV